MSVEYKENVWWKSQVLTRKWNKKKKLWEKTFLAKYQ